MCVKVCLALELLGFEAALNRARLCVSMVSSATAQDALEHAGAFASDGVGALAFTVMGIRQMAATALEAREKRGRLLARASSMADVVTAAALAENGGVAGDVYAAMGAEHADTVPTEKGSERAMTVEEDNCDGSVGQGAEAFGAEQPAGKQAEFRISEAGVKANLGKQGLLSIEGAIGIPSGNTAHLNMDPLLTQDDMTLPKHVSKVLLIREDVSQRDVASDGEGEVAGGNWGGIFDGMVRPGTFNKANGRVGHGMFDGGADAHDDLRGGTAVEFDKGPSPMLAAETSFAVGIREATIPSNDKAGRFDDRSACLGRGGGLGGGFGGRWWAHQQPERTKRGEGGPHASPWNGRGGQGKPLHQWELGDRPEGARQQQDDSPAPSSPSGQSMQ